ncbi:oxidoreductase [Apiospora sp. TS-2023a]
MPQPRLPVPTKINRDTGYPTISATRPENSARDKTVVVTGGGTGIGAETARFFAAAGALRILLIGRRPEPLLATKADIESRYPGTTVTATPTDVTDKAQVDAAFSNFVNDGDGAKPKQIDVLISNAGMTGPLDGVDDVDPAAFLAGVQANVGSALLVAQAFLRYATEDAVAVNVSSNASYLNFANAFASYSVGKLAAYRVWDAVAFGHPRLRVYHLQPGIVDTAMNREAGGVEALGYEDHVSLPAGFMLWLASPEAAFLKGKFLWSNWDVDELKARAEEIESSDEFNMTVVGWSGKDSKAGSATSASDLWKK